MSRKALERSKQVAEIRCIDHVPAATRVRVQAFRGALARM
jgi:hypothetical protein